MQIVGTALGRALDTGAIFGLVWLMLIVLECAFPRSKVSWHSRLRALTFWALSIPVWALLFAAFYAVWRQLGITPMLSASTKTGLNWLDVAIAIVAGNLIADLFFYWRHRAQHAFFWRYHSVHHSIRELSSLGSYHHLSEEIFRIGLVVIPMSLLVSIEAGVTGGLVGYFHGFYIHSSTRLHLPPILRAMVGDNAYHRIHHSTQPEHFNRNFAIFPIWDVVFGTAYFPKDGEWPETGLSDQPQPDGLSDWLAAPWRDRVSVEDSVKLSEQVVLPTQQ